MTTDGLGSIIMDLEVPFGYYGNYLTLLGNMWVCGCVCVFSIRFSSFKFLKLQCKITIIVRILCPLLLCFFYLKEKEKEEKKLYTNIYMYVYICVFMYVEIPFVQRCNRCRFIAVNIPLVYSIILLIYLLFSS